MDRIPMTMTPEREPVDDAALIAEAYRNTAHTASDTVFGLEILRLERTGWQPPAPEPDRVEVLACELWNLEETASWGERKTIIRRHFDELRAEWEAERSVIDVPEDVIEAANDWKHNKTGAGHLARFILQLAKGPSQ